MKTLIILAPISIALFCAMAATAQNLPQRPPALAGAGRFFPALNQVLTDDQRQSLRSILERQRDRLLPLEEKLRVSRQALLDAAVGGKFNENVVRQNAQTSAGAEAELTVIFARALSQMQPPLSEQQVRQLKNSQPGRLQPQAGPAAESGPEKHLPVPSPLPRDTNDLPVLK